MFNAVRQLGGAIGVAILTTVIVFVHPVHLAGGHPVPNLAAYQVAFLVAAAIALARRGLLAVHPRRRRRRHHARPPRSGAGARTRAA